MSKADLTIWDDKWEQAIQKMTVPSFAEKISPSAKRINLSELVVEWQRKEELRKIESYKLMNPILYLEI